MKKNCIVTFLFLLMLTTGIAAQGATPQESLVSLATGAEKSSVIEGKNGWLFLKEELIHLGSKTFFGESLSSDPVPAIVDFNKQLQDENIDLLLVLIPPKALIYPDMLPGDFTEAMASELEKPYLDLYAKLDQEGVQTLNLERIYRNARKNKQVYCKTDSHYSGQGLDIVAKELTAQISAKPWYSAIPKVEYSLENKKVTIKGDLSQMLGSPVTEELVLSFVTNSTAAKSVTPDKESPILLLGDSHTLVFSVGGDLHTNGAGLFDHLTAALGFPADRIGVRGSGATPSRIKLFQRSRKDSTFLSKKKMIIWCLSARELTGAGGWRKIPIAKK